MLSSSLNGGNENICVAELEKLKLQDDESKFLGEVEFDLGVIDSPIYGVAHIKGTLPLVSKQGIYPLESDPNWKKETEEQAFEIISSWFIKHKLNLGHKKKRDGIIRNGIKSALVLMPPRKLNPSMVASMCMINIGYYLDDIEEDTGIMNEFAGLSMSMNGNAGIMGIFSDILGGKYKSLAELPKIPFPLLKPVFWFTFLAHEQLSLIPEYNTSQIKYVIKYARRTYESSRILGNLELADGFSNHLFSELRQYDAGGGIYIDFVYMSEQILIPKEIRSSLIFISINIIACKIVALVNDLLGLRKDVNLDKPINSVLKNVKSSRISLQEGVQIAVAEIKAMTKDIVLALDFINNQREDCNEIVKCIKYVMDGNISQYDDENIAKKRWGKLSLKKIYY